MLITMCKGKIHRAKVTEACLDYRGSITIGKELMEAAGILPYELVHVNSMANAAHWETYAIPGKKGEICLNGCPARIFMPGDEVIILSLGIMTQDEAKNIQHRVVMVDDSNSIMEVILHG